MNESDPLTERIIGCAYRVHTELVAGLKEKIYQNVLKITFDRRGMGRD